MLAIKLRRVGKKKQASYRVVAAEKRSKTQGRFVEDLGWYNPHTNEFKISKDRAEYRLKTGARPTDTAHNLLVRAGILAGPKKAVHKKGKAEAANPAGEAKPAETAA